MKVKPVKEMDVEVIGREVGTGKYAGQLDALVCRTPEGKEFNLGSGFSDSMRASYELLAGAICEITYQELTLDGVPRFARFKRWRPDKQGG